MSSTSGAKNGAFFQPRRPFCLVIITKITSHFVFCQVANARRAFYGVRIPRFAYAHFTSGKKPAEPVASNLEASVFGIVVDFPAFDRVATAVVHKFHSFFHFVFSSAASLRRCACHHFRRSRLNTFFTLILYHIRKKK